MPDLLPVTKIQRFSTRDGPGVRTTVFLKGCPLRCAWCHNPETQEARLQLMYAERLCYLCGGCAAVCPEGAHRLAGEVHRIDWAACRGCGACAKACPTGACERSGQMMSMEEILDAVLQDRPFYGPDGGLTLSGGEPMAHPAAAIALLRRAKATGLHTAIETCGYFPASYIPYLAQATDLFLWDYKDSDDLRHRAYTGVSNGPILENLRLLDMQDVRIELRCILVRQVNLNDAHLEAIARMYHGLRHASGVTLLPYHAYGSSKAVQLGRTDNAHPEWVPSAEEMAHARAYLTAQGVKLMD